MEVTFRLMQESGVQGPKATETFGDSVNPTRDTLERLARLWANGQFGHPWDALTVEVDGDCFEVEM